MAWPSLPCINCVRGVWWNVRLGVLDSETRISGAISRTPSYQAKCRIRIRTDFQVFDPLGRVQNGQKFGNWRVCRVRKTGQNL